jgi:uncharacterized MAPEG superfamily protein
MTEEIGVETGSDWKKFIRKHWNIFAVFAVLAVLAFVGAVYVFVWFVGNAQSTGMVPATLSIWTMDNVLMFILHALFWELLLIGVPAIIAAVVTWQWWKRLPAEEKKEYNLFGKRSRSNSAGGAISTLLFIAFAIKVYVDGNWNTAISSWTLNYVIGSMITIIVWIVAITAIPTAIGGIWWIRHEMK